MSQQVSSLSPTLPLTQSYFTLQSATTLGKVIEVTRKILTAMIVLPLYLLVDLCAAFYSLFKRPAAPVLQLREPSTPLALPSPRSESVDISSPLPVEILESPPTPPAPEMLEPTSIGTEPVVSPVPPTPERTPVVPLATPSLPKYPVTPPRFVERILPPEETSVVVKPEECSVLGRIGRTALGVLATSAAIGLGAYLYFRSKPEELPSVDSATPPTPPSLPITPTPTPQPEIKISTPISTSSDFPLWIIPMMTVGLLGSSVATTYILGGKASNVPDRPQPPPQPAPPSNGGISSSPSSSTPLTSPQAPSSSSTLLLPNIQKCKDQLNELQSDYVTPPRSHPGMPVMTVQSTDLAEVLACLEENKLKKPLPCVIHTGNHSQTVDNPIDSILTECFPFEILTTGCLNHLASKQDSDSHTIPFVNDNIYRKLEISCGDLRTILHAAREGGFDSLDRLQPILCTYTQRNGIAENLQATPMEIFTALRSGLSKRHLDAVCEQRISQAAPHPMPQTAWWTEAMQELANEERLFEPIEIPLSQSEKITFTRPHLRIAMQNAQENRLFFGDLIICLYHPHQGEPTTIFYPLAQALKAWQESQNPQLNRSRFEACYAHVQKNSSWRKNFSSLLLLSPVCQPSR